jgi:phage portal protein, HK97 family|nr:MAG TPA: portal protein [Caudoviricetes sp.]
MGIFDKLFKRGKSQTMFTSFDNSGLGIMYDGDGYIPLARNPDVIMAVNKIADMVSNMTIQLMENTESGDVRIKDGLARKIDINPCDHMTRKTWIFKIVRDLLLFGDGNSVLHVEYDPMTDYISNLRPFPMSEVSFKSNDLTYMIHFRDTDFNPDEVVHFAINPDPDRPYIGTGFRLALKDIVRNLNMATQTKKGFMNGKNVPSLIVKVDSSSEELGTVEGREKIAKKYLTTSQSGEPWIVPDALMEVEQVKPLSLNDIALNESVEIDKKTVAGMLGVPAFVLGVGDFNKEEYNNFVNTTIMSIATTITQTLTRDLLTSTTRYFKFNPRSLYSYDITELSTVAQQMTNSAAMRRNEWRDWVGMTPDPEMDEIIVLENYLPQGELGNQSKLNKEGGNANEET